MKSQIGIRREDKNQWERRVALTPTHVKELREKFGLNFVVQPSKIRIFKDEEYKSVGAEINEDLSKCPIIVGVKEMPIDFFEKNKTYILFSHVIKGQKYNMPMLKKMMELGSNLIDYEKVTDDNGRRLIFFGKHAGLAGMIDGLWALGKRLESQGIKSPFSRLKKALEYDRGLVEAKEEIKKVGEEIEKNGLDDKVTPMVFGVTGYGHVSQGAQEILDLLPIKEIEPKDIGKIPKEKNKVFKVVFKEEHIVKTKYPNSAFDLKDYFNNAEKYEGIFESYVPNLSVVVNCIYWDFKYPRLITKKYLKESWQQEQNPKLQVIADISCDVEGSIEATVKVTTPGDPIFVYDPIKDKAIMGCKGRGPVILGVDNLPCEIPRAASTDFGEALKKFIPEIAKADFSYDFNKANLPDEIKRAMILWHGELTGEYKYIEKYL